MIRYFLLSTHYRRPIEFTDEVIANCQKAFAVFTRLFERIERLGKPAGQAGESELSKEVEVYRQRFLDMMDDDFNTAGAIAAMHELAGAINGYVEKSGVEKSHDPAATAAAADATAKLRELGGILGMFRFLGQQKAAGGEDAETVERLMQLLIQVRADARKAKNFATADAVRKGLTEIGITLEDRPDGTIWRKG